MEETSDFLQGLNFAQTARPADEELVQRLTPRLQQLSPAVGSLPSPSAQSFSTLSPQMAALELSPQTFQLSPQTHSLLDQAAPHLRLEDAPAAPPEPRKACLLPATERYVIREAVPDDAANIIELTTHLDMTNATSFVWPESELRQRISNRAPLVIVAFERNGFDSCCGVTGIDLYGMEKSFPVFSIGSRAIGIPANSVFDIPSTFCMCRGLLISPVHQGSGLGSLMHRLRMVTLSRLAPTAPCVILSARGNSFEEAMETLRPVLSQERIDDATPAFTKEELFEFTFSTSQGVVHLAHNRELMGWKFIGVDVADGGPVWCTSKPLPEITEPYSELQLEERAPLARKSTLNPNEFKSSLQRGQMLG